MPHPHSHKPSRFLLVLLALSPIFHGCVTVEEVGSSNSEQPLGSTDNQTAYNAARIIGLRDGDVMTGKVRGDSMEPVLQDGTVILLRRIDFSELEVGMDVAYTNRRGEQVVHQLVRRRGNAWVAKGINNPREDPDLVTSENLIGVLYGIFYNQGIHQPADPSNE